MPTRPGEGHRGWLPHALTPLVGRRQERLQLHQLIDAARLLTVVGAGGAGKTRLAQQVADESAARFSDGVWFVTFESINAAELVAPTVAASLGIREELDRSVPDTLAGSLRTHRCLLVLDNCEHLVLAVAQLADFLLQRCPELRVLATSRQPLGITGETTWRIPPLAVPNPGRQASVERLRQLDSVQLFVQRAAAVAPDFALTEQNATTIAELCRRLDGMPLALELAAARVRVLSVDQIEARLDDRFRLLTDGSSTALPRQRTLLETLDWSHGLLSEPEQVLFRRLSVFAGGWPLEAAEAVAGAASGVSGHEVVDLLGQLVDKSLVVAETHPNGVMRYRFLETIRQYSLQKLQACDEQVEVRDRHAAWMLGLAVRIGPGTNGPDQTDVLKRLRPELSNLRVALDRAASGEQPPEPALRACVACYRVWLVDGLLSEGRERLVQLARLSTDPSSAAWRAYALFGAGTLAMFQGDYASARTLVEESLALARDTDNGFQVSESSTVLALLQLNAGEATTAWALMQDDLAQCRDRLQHAEDAASPGAVIAGTLYGPDWPHAVLGRALMIAGVGARVRGNAARAQEFYEEALQVLERQGDRWFIAQVVSDLGLLALDRRDLAQARARFERALEIRRGLGDRTGTARSLQNLGAVAALEGDLDSAHAYHGEALAIVRELGDRSGVADALVALGELARQRGDLHAARRFLRDSLQLRNELGHRLAIPRTLSDLADLACAEGDPVRASRLAGAAAALSQTLGSTGAPPQEPSQAESDTVDPAGAVAWAEGQAMTVEHAVAYALSQEEGAGASTRARPARPSHGPLSPREVAVARLIALGRTNRQIASELVIAEGTADRHVSNILGKLGLGSRAQVALWVAEHGILPSTRPELS